MKTRGIVSVLAVIAVGWLGWTTRQATAADQGKQEYLAFGQLGIVRGQSARLNAVSVGLGRDREVELLFLDQEGNVLERSEQVLAPGHCMSLTLPFPEQRAGDGRAVQIHALVKWIDPTGRERGYIIPTFEVTDDATGKTTIMSGDPIA